MKSAPSSFCRLFVISLMRVFEYGFLDAGKGDGGGSDMVLELGCGNFLGVVKAQTVRQGGIWYWWLVVPMMVIGSDGGGGDGGWHRETRS